MMRVYIRSSYEAEENVTQVAKKSSSEFCKDLAGSFTERCYSNSFLWAAEVYVETVLETVAQPLTDILLEVDWIFQ